jgi:hypothetical protein
LPTHFKMERAHRLPPGGGNRARRFSITPIGGRRYASRPGFSPPQEEFPPSGTSISCSWAAIAPRGTACSGPAGYSISRHTWDSDGFSVRGQTWSAGGFLPWRDLPVMLIWGLGLAAEWETIQCSGSPPVEQAYPSTPPEFYPDFSARSTEFSGANPVDDGTGALGRG